MAWDGIYNHDPDTGVHRGYDALAPYPPRVAFVIEPSPVKPWAELSEIERQRGYDNYGRSVSEPAQTGAPLGSGETDERPAGTGWV